MYSKTNKSLLNAGLYFPTVSIKSNAIFCCKCLIDHINPHDGCSDWSFVRFHRESSFGLKDRHTQNLDIKLVLLDGRNLWIDVNGKQEKEIEDSSMTK